MKGSRFHRRQGTAGTFAWRELLTTIAVGLVIGLALMPVMWQVGEVMSRPGEHPLEHYGLWLLLAVLLPAIASWLALNILGVKRSARTVACTVLLTLGAMIFYEPPHNLAFALLCAAMSGVAWFVLRIGTGQDSLPSVTRKDGVA